MTTINELYEKIREEHREVSQSLAVERGNNYALRKRLEQDGNIIKELQNELKVWRHRRFSENEEMYKGLYEEANRKVKILEGERDEAAQEAEKWQDLYEQADQEVRRLKSAEEPGCCSQKEYVEGYTAWVNTTPAETAPEALASYHGTSAVAMPPGGTQPEVTSVFKEAGYEIWTDEGWRRYKTRKDQMLHHVRLMRQLHPELTNG